MADAEVLIQAHIARAKMLVIAIPDTIRARKMIDIARTINPSVVILVRTHTEEESTLLRNAGGVEVFMGEHELALGMTRAILEHDHSHQPVTARASRQAPRPLRIDPAPTDTPEHR